MRAAFTLALMGFLATASGANAEECGPVKMINQVQMHRIEGDNRDSVTFTVNGQYTQFLLATAGSMTQIREGSAKYLNLVIQPGNIRLYDMNGGYTNSMATVRDFSLGIMHGTFGRFPITPNTNSAHPDPFDGILALDYLRKNDVEVDFGTDRLNLFSPDHCPGHVVYWQGPTATVPFTRSSDQQHIVIPVTLDGQEVTALIDTGSSQTSMRIDIAESNYKLTLGAADTPENSRGMNGNKQFKTYRHTFKTMSFGDITVTNPHIVILPNEMGNDNDRWGRATRLAQLDVVNAPQLVIGMDVLRKLRLYMAFGEEKMYISPASAPSAGAPPTAPVMPAATSGTEIAVVPATNPLQADYRAATMTTIASMTQKLPSNNNSTAFLNNLCFLRATVKADLDAAQELCNRANTLQPRNEHIMDNVAFVLYQKGDYKDAIAAYDANLALHPRHADSLFMRGFAKGKLGDAAGKEADIAAAKAINPGIVSEFAQFDIDY